MTSKQKPAQRAAHITGVGISCATGTAPAALFGAVAGNLCCARPMEGLMVAPVCPPFVARVHDIPAEIETPQRLSLLVQDALFQACQTLANVSALSRLLVVTLLSSDLDPDQQQSTFEEFDRVIGQAHPLVENATRRIHTVHQGSVKELASILDEFSGGTWDAILFGGVDCLTGQRTLLELAEGGHCFTEHFPEGIIPGEAAAYVILTHSASPESPCITAIGHAAEHHSGQALHQEMTGLATAVRNTLTTSAHTAQKIDCIISSYPDNATNCIEWYQAQQKVWGEEHLSGRTEELNLHPTLGDTGTASVPLALALAWQRFRFEFPAVENILICETGKASYRGAVLLQKEQSNQPKPIRHM